MDEYFNNKGYFYSDSCAYNNINFKKSGDDYSLVMKGQYIQIDCEDFHFLFTDSEQASEAYKLILKAFRHSQHLLILNSNNQKVSSRDTLKSSESYTIQALYQFYFICLDFKAQTHQLLNYYSTVFEAQKQLALVYSNDDLGSLNPEDIKIYIKSSLNLDKDEQISNSNKSLVSFQESIRNFYFRIEAKNKNLSFPNKIRSRNADYMKITTELQNQNNLKKNNHYYF